MARIRGAATVLGAVAAVVLGLFGPVPPAGATPPPTPGQPGPAAGRTGPAAQVTLITGDRVTVRADGRVDVHPAPGREDMTFQRREFRGRTTVLPADAARAVRQGRLDQRLFDVTLLLRSGYSDAERDDLPLLLTHAAGAAAAGTARGAGGTDVRPLAGGRVTALSAPKAGGGRLWSTLTGARSAVRKVWLDGQVRATLDRSVPQIGAPAAWRAGHTGAGTTVAVLDTGIDTDHPDFAGAVTGSQDFTENPGGVQDGHGHGTHVASIVTGSGAASDGRYAGVAPDTRLLVGKVLDDSGSGFESQVIAGMEWAAGQDADVVNMSLGSDFQTDGLDPMSQELNRLTRETGTLFVVAAGNSGPSDSSVGSPGAADEALTVGAVDSADQLAFFSSRGPRTGDGAIKPDLTAPGVDIVAARATGSAIGEPVGEDYQRLSGTSMAAPHVAGAAAILAGQHPDWTAGQLKAALVASTKPAPGVDVQAQGSGRVDVARATTQTAWASPVSVNGGVALWPHDDDVPVTRELTYTNAGATPLVLDLAADVRGPEGTAAPAGMVQLSAGTLTVPAGGTAAVTVTFDTAVETADGRYGGLLTATARDGHTVLRTALAVDREVESYDYTLTVRDQNGAPTPYFSFWFLDLDTGDAVAPYHESGTVRTRLPKGRYFVDGWVQPVGGAFDLANFWEPTVVVSGPGSLTFDARRAKPVGLRTERPAEPGSVVLSYERTVLDFGIGLWIFSPDFEGLTLAPSRTSTPPGTFTVNVEGVLAKRDAGGGFRDSPYQYHLGWTARGRVPADLVRSYRDRDLGVGHTIIAGADPGLTAVKDGVAELGLPGKLTELYSPGRDWYGTTLFFAGTPWESLPVADWRSHRPRRYAAGSQTTERWARAVIGPVLPAGYDEWVAPDAFRAGDTIAAGLALHGDAAGHPGYASATGSTELYRDGTLVGSSPYPGGGEWQVPAGPATYRLDTTATGDGVGGLSTEVTASWTFRSGTTTTVVPLPLLAVRFAPGLDSRNTAPAGRAFAVPVRVDRFPGGAYGTIGAPAVQVSYDEGRTWRSAPVAGGSVRLTHPAGARSVSFRATAADSKGNKVTQTIIRAYLLR